MRRSPTPPRREQQYVFAPPSLCLPQFGFAPPSLYLPHYGFVPPSLYLPHYGFVPPHPHTQLARILDVDCYGKIVSMTLTHENAKFVRNPVTGNVRIDILNLAKTYCRSGMRDLHITLYDHKSDAIPCSTDDMDQLNKNLTDGIIVSWNRVVGHKDWMVMNTCIKLLDESLGDLNVYLSGVRTKFGKLHTSIYKFVIYDSL